MPGIKAEVFVPEVANHVPHVRVSWDAAAKGITPAEAVKTLRDGEPSIGPYRDRPTVHAAFGGGGSGFQSAPGIGRSVAEWIVHSEPRTVPGVVELSPDRASVAATG